MSASILILEDEPLIAWDIEEELTARGWQIVATTSTISGAMEAVANNTPEIALLDINLGRETSFDVARHCDAKGISVIFLTGESVEARPEDLRHLPVCGKPVAYDALQSVLTDVTAQGG